MSRRTHKNTAFMLDGRHLSIVQGRASSRGIHVTGGLSVRVPDPIKLDDMPNLGAWMRQGFDKHRLHRGWAVTLVVPRREVVLKMLDLPGGSLRIDEIVPMVRLRLARQLPFDADQASVDYTEIERDERGVRILAAAVSGALIAQRRAQLKAGGLRLGRVVIRPDAVAALLPADAEHEQLAIVPSTSSPEFVIVRTGRVIFARSPEPAGVTVPPGNEGEAGWLAVQAKRAIMSYRVSLGGEAPASAWMIGADTDDGASALIESETGLCPRSLLSVPGVSGHESLPARQMADLLPLIGALRMGVDEEGIDFAHPATPPDRRASMRQALLLAMLCLIAIVGGAWVLGKRATGQLDRQIEAGVALRDEARGAYLRTIERDARTKHAIEWSSVGFDWLAHLEAIADELPAQAHGTIDRLDANMIGTVEFAKGTRSAYPGTWTAPASATIRINGRIGDRGEALALRQRLVASRDYRVVLRGPDVDDTFSVELWTATQHPGVTP